MKTTITDKEVDTALQNITQFIYDSGFDKEDEDEMMALISLVEAKFVELENKLINKNYA